MSESLQDVLHRLDRMEEEISSLKQENKKLQRYKDYREIMNAIAAHSYCYNCHAQAYEVENFWTKEQPDSYYNACTSPEGVKAYYVGNTKKARDRQRQIVRDVYGVELQEPENVGYRVFNMLGTPYVVIAEDGMTAQGIWMEFSYKSHLDAEGKPSPVASLGKTCAEFVKEDGRWKLWRMRGMPGGFDLDIPMAQHKSMEEMTEEEREYTTREMNWAYFPFTEEEKAVLKQRFLTTERDPMGFPPFPTFPQIHPFPNPTKPGARTFPCSTSPTSPSLCPLICWPMKKSSVRKGSCKHPSPTGKHKRNMGVPSFSARPCFYTDSSTVRQFLSVKQPTSTGVSTPSTF